MTTVGTEHKSILAADILEIPASMRSPRGVPPEKERGAATCDPRRRCRDLLSNYFDPIA
jgi:hypothetical protein